MRCRTIAGVLGACLVATLGVTAPTALAETPTPPDGCPAQAPPPAWTGYDPDCVTLQFTSVPSTPTLDTSATITWQVSVFGAPEFSDWTTWDNKVCTLDGTAVDCESAVAAFSGLAVGEHVFTVQADTPFPFEEGPRSAVVNPNSECDEFFSEGDYTSCVRVSGEVRWTVEAPPVIATGPAAAPAPAAPAPVVTAAAPAAPKVCTSRRTLTIRLRERKNRKIRSARVEFNGKTIATSRRTRDGRLVAKIDMRTLPAGRFSVKIRAKLRNGRTVTYTRRYFTCKPKLDPSNKLESAGAL